MVDISNFQLFTFLMLFFLYFIFIFTVKFSIYELDTE